MAKQVTEGKIGKVQVAVRIEMEVKAKVMRAFRKEGMTTADAFIAAIRKATEGVKLTNDDMKEI